VVGKCGKLKKEKLWKIFIGVDGIMSLKNLNLKNSYDSDQDDILDNFYIPALSEAVLYKRIGGYFSSAAFSLASRGLSKFLLNNGRMQLLVNHVLQRSDKDVIEKIYSDQKYIENILKEDVNSWNLENKMVKNHVMILGWMLAHKLLDLKIAITVEPQIFHQKIGILIDNEGNKISFSGSNNETVSGWKSNIEEFKVFKNWITEQRKYLESDEEKFNSFWNGRSRRFIVVDAPTAVRKKLIKTAPKRFEDLQFVNTETKTVIGIDRQEPITNNNLENKKELFDYQKMAIRNWIKNKYKGIFEMATGSGKTFTSLNAIKQIFEDCREYCTIVAVPYKHLATQWISDIKELFPNSVIIEAHSDSLGWQKKLNEFLSDYKNNLTNEIFIVISYDTLATVKFQNIFTNNFNIYKTYVLIADEVHNIGSPIRMQGMIKNINFRLGLSATPTRWFDEEGSEKIMSYFQKTVFKFDLKMAIENGCLTHYEYHPIFVQMSEQEIEKYYQFTRKIMFSRNREKDPKDNDLTKFLLIKRSKIIKNLDSKIVAFESLIKKINQEGGMDHLLIYCDSGGQLQLVQKLLNEYGIINHKFTQIETNDQRKKILSDFDQGIYNCLVAVKCLDEGVNVPSTKTAIILASSTNPREYIQRRGRVLRKHKGKEKATIYDFTVLPVGGYEEKELALLERKIFKKELKRIYEFIETSNNKAEIIPLINEIMIKYDVYIG